MIADTPSREGDSSEKPDPDGVFEVENIVGRRVHQGRVQYNIKWANWADEHNTWEDEKNLMCADKLHEFMLNEDRKRGRVLLEENCVRCERLRANVRCTNDTCKLAFCQRCANLPPGSDLASVADTWLCGLCIENAKDHRLKRDKDPLLLAISVPAPTAPVAPPKRSSSPPPSLPSFTRAPAERSVSSSTSAYVPPAPNVAAVAARLEEKEKAAAAASAAAVTPVSPTGHYGSSHDERSRDYRERSYSSAYDRERDLSWRERSPRGQPPPPKRDSKDFGRGPSYRSPSRDRDAHRDRYDPPLREPAVPRGHANIATAPRDRPRHELRDGRESRDPRDGRYYDEDRIQSRSSMRDPKDDRDDRDKLRTLFSNVPSSVVNTAPMSSTATALAVASSLIATSGAKGSKPTPVPIAASIRADPRLAARPQPPSRGDSTSLPAPPSILAALSPPTLSVTPAALFSVAPVGVLGSFYSPNNPFAPLRSSIPSAVPIQEPPKPSSSLVAVFPLSSTAQKSSARSGLDLTALKASTSDDSALRRATVPSFSRQSAIEISPGAPPSASYSSLAATLRYSDQQRSPDRDNAPPMFADAPPTPEVGPSIEREPPSEATSAGAPRVGSKEEIPTAEVAAATVVEEPPVLPTEKNSSLFMSQLGSMTSKGFKLVWVAFRKLKNQPWSLPLLPVTESPVMTEEFDLLWLFQKVTSLGGAASVSKQLQWKEVAMALTLSSQSRRTVEGKAYLMNVPFIVEVLKAFYGDNLWEFEQDRCAPLPASLHSPSGAKKLQSFTWLNINESPREWLKKAPAPKRLRISTADEAEVPATSEPPSLAPPSTEPPTSPSKSTDVAESKRLRSALLSEFLKPPAASAPISLTSSASAMDVTPMPSTPAPFAQPASFHSPSLLPTAFVLPPPAISSVHAQSPALSNAPNRDAVMLTLAERRLWMLRNAQALLTTQQPHMLFAACGFSKSGQLFSVGEVRVNGRVHACAEAVLCAVAASENEALETVLVLNWEGKLSVPCGACRELLSTLPDLEVIVPPPAGFAADFQAVPSSKLLPPLL